MKNTVRVPISVLALILAAPTFATTPADNIAWSAKPVQRFVMPPECYAYSKRQISSDESLTTERVLIAAARFLTGTGPTLVIGGTRGAVPDPCASSGL
ncbi:MULTISPECIES: hypothetical protein [Burkholderia]|uniref:Uncharacterized protein n=1 Tax=Burkholderia contaminans TaxID=488447 RepID=A0A2S5DTK6_9BURK|nr:MULTISPECIES: hypothetical protein [Burkholderia]EKS9796853.1 hypothetical protein [Burkholderia cepacia]EKS9803674.1 hypothetical protein [Burkholderia cepacia]EKS9814769.1 hypothetical protein [Burkholderia cepacia]EKS9817953.1 hypothetical protein [Burkholderia cepacia]EKS9826238.1 hypothetical protein [Burkholderia cepacia]